MFSTSRRTIERLGKASFTASILPKPDGKYEKRDSQFPVGAIIEITDTTRYAIPLHKELQLGKLMGRAPLSLFLAGESEHIKVYFHTGSGAYIDGMF